MKNEIEFLGKAWLKSKDKKLVKEIKAFIDILESHNIAVKKLILFGSFAKNNPHKDSDIDLAVISSRFGKDMTTEMMLLSKLSWKASDRIEAIPLSEEYLKLKYHPFIGEIKKYGKVIYETE